MICLAWRNIYKQIFESEVFEMLKKVHSVTVPFDVYVLAGYLQGVTSVNDGVILSVKISEDYKTVTLLIGTLVVCNE